MEKKINIVNEQISILQIYPEEDVAELKAQAKKFHEYANAKRKWENKFQRWSDSHGMSCDNTESWGCCGYGSMCEWCDDPSFGRPCVRALNAMCREKGYRIDYKDFDFTKTWNGEFK